MLHIRTDLKHTLLHQSMQNHRWILITGASSGIGLVTVKLLQARHWQVIATARKSEDVQRLQAMGLRALQLDLNSQASIDSALDQAIIMAGGSIYGVFHNAGYAASGALEDLPVQAMADEFQANVFGAHHINTRLLPLMRQSGGGRIVFTSSVLGYMALRYRGAYVASKYAMEGMADTLRLELQGSGISVSLIEPGPVATHFRRNSLAQFEKHIRVDTSAHKEGYSTFLARLRKPGSTSRFTASADDVAQVVVNAFEARQPRARYRVTIPAKVFAFLKRVLPSRWMDAIAGRGT